MIERYAGGTALSAVASVSPCCRCELLLSSNQMQCSDVQMRQRPCSMRLEKQSHSLRLSIATRSTTESATSLPSPYGAGSIREIPVFPLGIVAFPTATVPLNIFEARYRVLFNTLLAGLKGIEEDLVNDQKPWCGTRLFGMCFTNQEGGMASIGTTLYIMKHDRLPDGRLLVINKGIEKFRILKVLEERPVLICQVEMLEDSEDASPQTAEAASAAIQLFKDLIELNVRMNRIPSREAAIDPEIDSMSPRETSYWLGLVFTQSPLLQQALLEEANLMKRLSQEREILEGTTKYLRAQVALRSAFSPETTDSSATTSAEKGSSDQEQSKEQQEDEPPSSAAEGGE